MPDTPLKPCPFCGESINLELKNKLARKLELAYRFECMECGGSTKIWRMDIQQAAEIWNRRSERHD